MKQKLILTLWKAQLSQVFPSDSLYCLLTYNNESKTSKSLQSKTSLQWKQTFVFSLSKQQSQLKIDFIPLKKGQQIHFAKDNVAEGLSVAKATLTVPVQKATKGSLPAKLDIIDQDNDNTVLGKVFVEYEVLKTQVAYLVQKMIDYNYLLKLSNFNVTFLRPLKKCPTFFLKLKYGQKFHRQEFPFNEDKGNFTYNNYPIKLYIQKQLQMNIELQVRQFFGLEHDKAYESIKSGSLLTERRSDHMSTIGKKNTMIELGMDSKIGGLMELNFKENMKTTKKVALTTMIKNQPRDIGSIEFQVEVTFKTQQQKQAFEIQKKGIGLKQNPQGSMQKKRKSPKSNQLQQSNGSIILNTIMGKLQLDQTSTQNLSNKNVSLTLKLGKQMQQSSILQNPGKQLIFLDTFTFKRTWQQTIKMIIQIHSPLQSSGAKMPTYHATLNLRELFQLGKVHSKKVKIFDENKLYCGQFVIDMEYREDQKKSKDLGKSVISSRKGSQEDLLSRMKQEKRQKIAERMKQRQSEKKQKVETGSFSLNKQRDIITMAQALDLKDLILPPLKSRKINSDFNQEHRYTTLSPSSSQNQKKFMAANIYNSNGGIKFSRSPRFDQNAKNNKSGGSFTLIRQSDFDFDSKKKKGAFIGYGDKHDFTKDVKHNPGIGKYQIPSLWDKYH